MSTKVHAPAKTAPTSSFTPVPTGLLQRKCACGGTAGLDGACTECPQEGLSSQSHSRSTGKSPALHSGLSGHDFSQVPLWSRPSRSIRPKPRISQPNDLLERETDRIADGVTCRPTAPAAALTRTERSPDQLNMGMERASDAKGALALEKNGEEQDAVDPDTPTPDSAPSAAPADPADAAPVEDEEVPAEAEPVADTEPTAEGAAATVIRGDFPRTTPKEYWFFDGETPPDYIVSTVLSTNRSGGSFDWATSRHLSLSSASDPTPRVTSAAPSSAREDAWIRVRHTDSSGVRTAASYRVTVLAPDSLDHQGTTHAPLRTAGFLSQIKYHILDQLGDVLPEDVPWNEDFNKDGLNAVTGVRDYPDFREDWGWGPESGWVVPPDNAVDNVGRFVPGSFPPHMPPQSPLTNIRIDHVIGAWFVGSTTIGSGRLVKDNNRWQIYIDHGEHE